MSRILILFLLFLAGVNSSKLPTRIVGGEPATIEEHPSIVSVEFWFSWLNAFTHSCGGTIINNRYILSAAHCFDGPEFAVGRVRLGSTYSNFGGTVISIDRVIIHPDWNFITSAGDICLAYLSNTIVYSDVIQRATIPPQGFELPDNLPVVFAGWGFISISGPISEYLRRVTVNTINDGICKDQLGGMIEVTDGMLCAGILGGWGQDFCSTDSGGPTYYNDMLVGVISISTCSGGLPSVSTKVSAYTNWIVENAV